MHPSKVFQREIESIGKHEVFQPVEEGSPLHRLISEHAKPAPDSADWWREVAQGLGVSVFVARRQRDELLAALKDAHQFISNGIEFGYIIMPDRDCGDRALQTPEIVRSAIRKAESGE